jgi:ligand-binding SRPBCC domain-containing protein
MKLLFETPINLPFEKVRDGFTRELFIYLSPPFISFTLKRFDGCQKGHEVHLELRPLPFWGQQWISVMTFEETNELGWSFMDEGRVLPWPLSLWRHHHRVDRVGPNQCKIVDDISFDCKPAFLAWIFWPLLWFVFSIRPRRYKKYFQGKT